MDGEEGVIQHSLLVLLLQERKMQKGGKKKKVLCPQGLEGGKTPQPTQHSLQEKKKWKKYLKHVLKSALYTARQTSPGKHTMGTYTV